MWSVLIARQKKSLELILLELMKSNKLTNAVRISKAQVDIVLNLQRIFYQHTSLVKMFKTALDRMPTNEYKVVSLADKTTAGEREQLFNAPTVDELAIVMMGNEFDRRDKHPETKRCIATHFGKS